MTDLEKKVKKQFELQKLKGQSVVVALSGGVDSVVLLDVLSRLVTSLGLKVEAAHVNHQRFLIFECRGNLLWGSRALHVKRDTRPC